MITLSERNLLRLKISASLILLAIIIASADWGEVWSNLQQLDLALTLVSFIILVLIISLSAWKWWVLLRIHRAPFLLSELNRWYFIALFFNNFLPTSIGGDGFRIYRTFNNNRSRSTAFVAVFIERVSGLITLLGLGWLAAVVNYFDDRHPLSGTFMYLGAGGIAVASIIILVAWSTNSYTRLMNWNKLPSKIQDVLSHLDDFAHDIKASVGVLILSILFHVLNIFALWLLLKALGANIAIIELTIVVALINVVSILPVSINGVGLVDGAYVFLLGQYGIEYNHGVSFSIVLRFVVLPISLAGMMLYLMDKRKDRANTPQSTTR